MDNNNPHPSNDIFAGNEDNVSVFSAKSKQNELKIWEEVSKRTGKSVQDLILKAEVEAEMEKKKLKLDGVAYE